MPKPFARKLYRSKRWQAAREAALSRSKGLCERCLRAGRITPAEAVHHKVPLTPENVDDPAIALGLDNLEALCKDCHELTHRELGEGAFESCARREKPRVGFDIYGNVVKLDE